MNNNIIDVLIVEDSSIDGVIAERILKRENNFRVSFANKAEKAVEMIKSKTFDVILLDLNLPDASGIETFDKIHSINKDIPIVLLSGSDNKFLILEMIKKGAQDFINKKNLLRHSLVDTVLFSIERQKAILTKDEANQEDE